MSVLSPLKSLALSLDVKNKNPNVKKLYAKISSAGVVSSYTGIPSVVQITNVNVNSDHTYTITFGTIFPTANHLNTTIVPLSIHASINDATSTADYTLITIPTNPVGSVPQNTIIIGFANAGAFVAKAFYLEITYQDSNLPTLGDNVVRTGV